MWLWLVMLGSRADERDAGRRIGGDARRIASAGIARSIAAAAAAAAVAAATTEKAAAATAEKAALVVVAETQTPRERHHEHQIELHAVSEQQPPGRPRAPDPLRVF
jgi:hypothetical protein